MFFRRKPQGVEIRFTLQGQRLTARVPKAVAAHCETQATDNLALRDEIVALHKLLVDTQTECDQIAQATTAMRAAHSRALAGQRGLTEQARAEATELRGKLYAAHIVNIRLGGELADKQGELERALEQVKKLDAELVEESGRLRDAEERLAGYERVTS